MLFKSKGYRELDEIVYEIRNDLSNNYKDNAVLGIKKLEKRLNEMKSEKALKPKEEAYFSGLLEGFQKDVSNFKRTY